MNRPISPTLYVPSRHWLDARNVNAPSAGSALIASMVASSRSTSIPFRIVIVSVMIFIPLAGPNVTSGDERGACRYCVELLASGSAL
jgi:hypothetical protein